MVSFIWRQNAIDTEPVVIIGDAGVGERVVCIVSNRLVISDKSLGETFFGEGVPVKSSAQV